MLLSANIVSAQELFHETNTGIYVSETDTGTDPNNPDTDGDGVGDNADAFPNDVNEITDTDGDGVGDNADAFPYNPFESLDDDNDGIGNNRDYRGDANFGMGNLIKLDGGTHTLGSNGQWDDNSDIYPIKEVTLSPFYIAETETNGYNWNILVNWAVYSGGYSDLGVWDSSIGRQLIGDSLAVNHPATTVRWMDAVKYCNAASEANGLRPVYYNSDGTTFKTGYPENGPVVDFTADGYRLPTEAEWEYAARGGLQNQLYPWGNNIDVYKANYGDQLGYVNTPYGLSYKRYNSLWYNANSDLGISTSPTATYAANGYGLRDMSGNVQEWCNDVKSNVNSNPETNPTGPEFGGMRVVRGGAYESLYLYLRNYTRYSGSATEGSRWPTYGFRIARSLDTDGDSISDMVDLFPLDHTETQDSDSDGEGDNADAFPDDASESVDTDGDGVGDNADVFPNDASESADTDGDGVGDNSDAFPNDASESADTDGDGVGDNADAFPNDASESTDTDGDGVGDNSDAFPNDASESVDTDGDGVGDKADVFPDDASESVDTDGDGVGDNADAFPNDPSASVPVELNDLGKLLVQLYDWIDNGDGTLTTPGGQIAVGYAKDPDPEPEPEPEPEPDGSLFVKNLSFEILGNVAQITGYNDSAPVELIIPSSYNGIPVTAISDDAFNGLGNIYSVYIPQSVTSIGHNAFRDCINLVNVEIRSINPSMGNFVFRGCSNLVNIMLPSSLSEVPGGIFTNCHSLQEVVVPESVSNIGEYAFFDCISMTGIFFLGDAPNYSQLSFGGTNNAKAKVLSSASGFPSSFYGNNPNLVVQYISLQDFPEYSPSELTLPIAVDTDGDGVGDNADAFPNDPNETADSDGDGTGDNEDVFPNDANESVDTDGDGVGDNADVFPNDASESADTDGDGVGDNADAFPNDANESADTDGDGVGDNADAFPNDANESVDTDGDGVGDNADAFPNDSNESVDTDGDGVGDNADAFPNDLNETTDADGDGLGDNADEDDDNDSLLDVKELLLGSDPLVADNFISIVSVINSLTDEGDSLPGNDELFSLQEIQDLRAGSTLIEIQNGQALLTMEVEESDDLAIWTSESIPTVQIPIQAVEGKKFFRFKITD